MSAYKVLINDNRYRDGYEPVTHAVFETAEEAVAACKEIVDDFLDCEFEPRMSATALYGVFEGCGEDPFLVPVNSKDAPVAFSASDYAKERCEIIGAPKPLRQFPPVHRDQ